MSSLFDSTVINGMVLKNRLVRSATWEGMCDPDGKPSKKLANYYRNLTNGGIGLLISGYAYIKPEGKQLPGKMGIYNDDFAGAYEKLVSSVHERGGKIAIQLVHAGGQALTENSGSIPLAPSAVKVAQYSSKPKELTITEIQEIVEAFGNAARRAKNYGFDAIQMHGAHGYLINQFMSPHTNIRTDEYGGSVENRSRFVLEVYQEIRKRVGPDYPVLIKMNCADHMEGGLEIEDGLTIAKKLSEMGIDSIEVSSGNAASEIKNGPLRMRINNPDKEAWNLAYAKKVKEIVRCPVMAVGGFRSFEVCEKAVESQKTDYVTMSRPIIREPDLPLRWKNGNRSPAKCISCNRCFQPGVEEGGIYCVADKNEKRKNIKTG